MHGEKFDKERYWQKRDAFGSIVFESDQDLPPAVVYKIYEARWDIELLFKVFKNEVHLEETNVQSDYSVIGSEFINFIATVLTHRMIKVAKEAGLLEHKTYGELMRDIGRTFRLKKFKDQEPVFKDGSAACPSQWQSLLPLVSARMTRRIA